MSSRRRATALAALLAAVPLVVVGGLGASPAQARDRTPFIVIGTADVNDSKLVGTVIEPDFEAAFPDIDFQYVPKGTGDAIALAETGAGAAIIVHAASLEQQFVDAGYSAEPAGRAVTYGDFVLAGRASDGAGVVPTGQTVSHDIVGAFEKIAAAGSLPKPTAEFVSRGGTSGTSVAEHALWAMTTGVPTCTIDPTKGGGAAPVKATSASVGGACAATPDYPAWYKSTGDSQAGNVGQADACNGYATDQCYVFTDRGTLNYLQSTSALAHLVIDVRDNAATAVGGEDALINSFHAYAVNPAAFPAGTTTKTDLPTATEFLDFITSPTEQGRINTYLSAATDGDVPFHQSAAPDLSLTTSATQVVAGHPFDISGTLANKVPGTPALAGKPVTLSAVFTSRPTAAPVVVATTTTGDQGQFQFDYTPKANLTYTVSTDEITQVERADIGFKDMLAPVSVSAGSVSVLGRIALTKANRVAADKHSLQVIGTLAPQVIGSTGHLALYLAKTGGTLALAGSQPLTSGQTSYQKTFKLNAALKGTYDYQVRYVNNGVIDPGSTRTYQVRFS